MSTLLGYSIETIALAHAAIGLFSSVLCYSYIIMKTGKYTATVEGWISYIVVGICLGVLTLPVFTFIVWRVVKHNNIGETI